jgi:hypothetical protein
MIRVFRLGEVTSGYVFGTRECLNGNYLYRKGG